MDRAPCPKEVLESLSCGAPLFSSIQMKAYLSPSGQFSNLHVVSVGVSDVAVGE